ncbi:MAG: hypothetical protein LUG45_05515 [Clostridiales bacterium]|nr:hypothetical protein [Clostridiales bacterium]
MKNAVRPGKLHTLCTVLCWCLSVLLVLSALGNLSTPAALVFFLLAAAAANPLVHRRLPEAKPWMFILAVLVCVMAAGSFRSETEPAAVDSAASSSLSDESLSEHDFSVSSEEADSALTAESGDAEEVIVYVTESGSKYHLSTCRYVKDGGIALTLMEAQEQGYEPCKVCCPPE